MNRPLKKRKKSEPIREEDLREFSLIRQFEKRLAKAAKGRQPSRSESDPWRELHGSQYFSLLLFGLFNPVVDSLRGLCQATGLERVQEFCARKIALGTLSEAQAVFDPELLAKVADELFENHPAVLKDKRLGDIADRIKLFDGSLLQGLSRMTWALWLDDEHTAAKLHLKYSLMKGSPEGMLLTAGNGSERSAALKLLKPGELGVFDRGYGSKYGFFEEVADKGCSFVGRIRNEPKFEVEQERALRDEDREAGVISDRIVLLGERKIQLRLVSVEIDGKRLVLATDRFDLAADLIALIYRYRWLIELFFKWIKCILGCRHLFAESPQGVTIQLYLTLIAAMLLTRFLGKKPTKRQMEILRFYMVGFCSIEELAKQLNLEKIAE